MEGKSMTDLPNEILLIIFSYLKTYDLKYKVPNVCVKWSELSTDAKLWRRFTFETSNKAMKTFGANSWYSTLRFLETTPFLHSISVTPGHTNDEVKEILTSINKNCPSVRVVYFHVDLGPVVGHIKTLHNILENIETLGLELDCAPRVELLKVLSDFKNLTKVSFLDKIPVENIFRQFLIHVPRLQHFQAPYDEISKRNFMLLLSKKDELVSLVLKIDELDRESIAFLRTFTKLATVSLIDSHSSAEKLSEIGKISCLTSLELSEEARSPVLTASALEKFFHRGSFPALTELKLLKSRLDDQGAVEIRRNCFNLRSFEMMSYPRSPSGLTERGLLHLLHCKLLESVEIIFDSSDATDWIYRRIRYVHHDCDANSDCSVGLEWMLHSWDEIQIPID